MAEIKKVGWFHISLVDNWRDWRDWWSLRWTTLAGVFSAMAAAGSMHAPWWFSPTCAAMAVLCNSASGAARIVAQKPKDDCPSIQ